jgi:regulator of sirC expression with transglutaminase-like and TPR domain
LGETDAAIQAYERYLTLLPKAKDAAKVRQHIKLLREPSRAGATRRPDGPAPAGAR